MPFVFAPPVVNQVKPIVDDVSKMIGENLQLQRNYANDAIREAYQFLDRIASVSGEISSFGDLDVLINQPQFNVTTYQPPVAVRTDDINLTPVVPAAPVAPAASFAFTEVTYSSALLTVLRDTLSSWVAGTATGLDPAVESRLWNRERARTAATTARKAAQLIREFAARGFAKPPGALALALAEAAQEGQDADIASSREIAVAQATLEQTNRHFALEKGLMNEAAMQSYASSIAQRALESAQFADKIAVEMFAARASIFSKQVDAEVGRVDAGSKALDARAKVLDSLVKGEVARVTADIEVLKSQTGLVVSEAGLRIEQFKANVQRLIQQTTLLMEAIKTGAQVSTQLAASALSGVNLSAGMHATGSVSDSNSTSNSTANSASSSDNYSTSTSKSTSDSTSKSTSDSTSHATSDSTSNSSSNSTVHTFTDV